MMKVTLYGECVSWLSFIVAYCCPVQLSSFNIAKAVLVTYCCSDGLLASAATKLPHFQCSTRHHINRQTLTHKHIHTHSYSTAARINIVRVCVCVCMISVWMCGVVCANNHIIFANHSCADCWLRTYIANICIVWCMDSEEMAERISENCVARYVGQVGIPLCDEVLYMFLKYWIKYVIQLIESIKFKTLL